MYDAFYFKTLQEVSYLGRKAKLHGQLVISMCLQHEDILCKDPEI